MYVTASIVFCVYKQSKYINKKTNEIKSLPKNEII